MIGSSDEVPKNFVNQHQQLEFPAVTKNTMDAAKRLIRLAPPQDIRITGRENDIIDTFDFQRLRRIKQLGLTYLVYPSANHTRFEHSLGTLAMATRMIESINNNPVIDSERDIAIDPEARTLIRLAALLHDVCHLPFGHTLEDEVRVMVRHDHNEPRLDHFLGPKSKIGQKLGEYRQPVLDILTAKEANDFANLRYPFAADIVANTICADLLDYLSRDVYFTGLDETYSTRFLDYLYVPRHGADAGRIVLRLWKRDDYRSDVLGEVLTLLRNRYSLGEKVYYHHAKLVAGAMIGRAFQDGHLVQDQLYNIGDDEFLALLRQNTAETTKELAELLTERSLYKRVYFVPFAVAKAHDELEMVTALSKDYHFDPEKRREVENNLATKCGLKPGKLLIYCPDPEMSLKVAKARVLWKKESIKIMSEIQDDDLVRDEVKQIQDKHRALWGFYVFLHPGEWEKAARVSKICEDHFDLRNRITVPKLPYDLVFETILDVGLKRGAERPLMDKVYALATSGVKYRSELTDEQWISYLYDQLDGHSGAQRN